MYTIGNWNNCAARLHAQACRSLICVVLYRPTDRGTVSASGGGNGLDSDGNTSDEEEYGVDLS